MRACVDGGGGAGRGRVRSTLSGLQRGWGVCKRQAMDPPPPPHTHTTDPHARLASPLPGTQGEGDAAIDHLWTAKAREIGQ